METKQKELIERQAETIVQQQEYLSQLQQLLQESLKLNVVGIGDLTLQSHSSIEKLSSQSIKLLKNPLVKNYLVGFRKRKQLGMVG